MKTARMAVRIRLTLVGATYHRRYLAGSNSVQPFSTCTNMAMATPNSRDTTRTPEMARIFGAANTQSGAGVESMISSVRRSRSRQTSSPA